MNKNEKTWLHCLDKARWVRVSTHLVELRGGSRADQIEAVDWISMFMPEVRRAPAV